MPGNDEILCLIMVMVKRHRQTRSDGAGRPNGITTGPKIIVCRVDERPEQERKMRMKITIMKKIKSKSTNRNRAIRS
jgi:hypothetical protein